MIVVVEQKVLEVCGWLIVGERKVDGRLGLTINFCEASFSIFTPVTVCLFRYQL